MNFFQGVFCVCPTVVCELVDRLHVPPERLLHQGLEAGRVLGQQLKRKVKKGENKFQAEMHLFFSSSSKGG